MSALERVLRVDTGHSAHARARHRAPSGDGQRDDQHAVPPARDGIRVSSRPDEGRRAGARELRDGAARTSSLRSGGSIRDSRRCAGRPRHPRSPGRAERVCFPRARLRERCPTRRLGGTIVARTGSVGPGRVDDPGTPAQRRTPDPMKRPRPTPSFILRRHFLAPMGSYDDVMSLSVRRGFLWPSVDLYGGFAGFYDYGHNGVLMRRQWEDLWTETFLGLSDNYYLIDTTTILPEAPLKASGHVDHFSDLLVTCTHCGESYRGDQLLEAATHEEHEGLTPAELDARIRELKIRCPNCKGELGPARPFNMMFPLDVGPTGKDRAYLRPETAQGVYLNFKREFEALRRKLPMGLAIVGRAYRNEISPRQGAYRMREFLQAELQIFFDIQVKQESLGGFKEVGGVHYRTDHDLKGHEAMSHAKQSVTFDGSRLIPHVLELSFGVDRNVWALLDLSYSKGERIVLRLPPRLAPVSVGVFPLVSKDGLPEKAEALHASLRKRLAAFYDDSGSIGRRYARMDEIGTPFTVTVDHESLEGKGVTVRERDSQKQIRLTESELADTLTQLLTGDKTFGA